MSTKVLRIATRKSPLAMWQAEHVQQVLQQAHPGLSVELVGMKTRGDHILDSPLSKIGGKGLFVKELEHAMLEGEADLAVHSMKDVPMVFPEGLMLSAIGEREDPRDAFVSNTCTGLDDLPQGSIVGTSSLRRQCQLQAMRPDLKIHFLRGNVNTRLSKLDAGEYDAIILAAAGLKRLGFDARIASYLEPEVCLPAGGQGAIGIELRTDDTDTQALVQVLHHDKTAFCVMAERAMNIRLNGGCQVPIGAYAVLQDEGQTLWLRGLVGSSDGKKMLYAEAKGAPEQAQKIGEQVAEELLAQGADAILNSIIEPTK